MSQQAEVADATVDPPSRPLMSNGRRQPSPWALLVLILVPGILVAALFVQHFQSNDLLHQRNALQSEQATRREIAAAAGAFGEALLSYDYNDLNAARTRVLSLSTDSFGQQYTTAFTGGLDVAITKLQATSKATVDNVYVSDAVGDTAKAVVTLDSEVHSTAGTRRTVGSYLDVTLKHENGAWKVDTVTSVAALDQQTIAPDGTVSDSGTTSSTVVPGVPDTSATTTTVPGG